MHSDTPDDALEAELLAKLKHGDSEDAGVLEDLLNLYIRRHACDKAESCIHRLRNLCHDPHDVAYLLLRLGQVNEQKRNYELAEMLYRDSLTLGHLDADLEYWANNNLGFCLNVLGRPGEAEPYLKRAASLVPTRSNAFKNLGLCFQHLGRSVDAVEQFITATHVNPADSRSLAHLEVLLVEQPELFSRVPDLECRVRTCRSIVNVAQS